MVIYAKYVITHTCVGQKVDGQTATCTVDGWRDYYECECGKYYEDENCTTPILDLAAWKIGDGKITATHNHSADWESDENSHWNECACGDKVNIAEHKDENEDGICDVCEYEVGLPEEEPNGGLGAGALIGIILGSTLVLGTGGFAIFWFVIKKKSFADLGSVFKSLWAKIKNLFKKKNN